MTEKPFIDDFAETPFSAKDSEEKQPKTARKRENLKDIINAVAEKEDVITSFKSPQNRLGNRAIGASEQSLRKHIWRQFLGGVAFAAGAVVLLAAVWLIFALINLHELRLISRMFSKFVVLMKSLGR
jgi:ferric-dicitrate binding protein FerR (iron transport regulator)